MQPDAARRGSRPRAVAARQPRRGRDAVEVAAHDAAAGAGARHAGEVEPALAGEPAHDRAGERCGRQGASGGAPPPASSAGGAGLDAIGRRRVLASRGVVGAARVGRPRSASGSRRPRRRPRPPPGSPRSARRPATLSPGSTRSRATVPPTSPRTRRRPSRSRSRRAARRPSICSPASTSQVWIAASVAAGEHRRHADDGGHQRPPPSRGAPARGRRRPPRCAAIAARSSTFEMLGLTPRRR